MRSHSVDDVMFRPCFHLPMLRPSLCSAGSTGTIMQLDGSTDACPAEYRAQQQYTAPPAMGNERATYTLYYPLDRGCRECEGEWVKFGHGSEIIKLGPGLATTRIDGHSKERDR